MISWILKKYYIYKLSKRELFECGKAAKALGVLGDPDAIEPLSELVSDKYGFTPDQISAAEALAQIGDPRGIESIKKVLVDHPEYLEKAAADTTGYTADKDFYKFVKPLMELATSNNDSNALQFLESLQKRFDKINEEEWSKRRADQTKMGY